MAVRPRAEQRNTRKEVKITHLSDDEGVKTICGMDVPSIFDGKHPSHDIGSIEDTPPLNLCLTCETLYRRGRP